MKRIVWLTMSVLLLLIIIIQFIPVKKLKSDLYPASDFFALNTASASLQTIIKNACYDCHSNETRFPWYSKIAPVSWFINDHITEGRDNLNFSDWGLYSSNEIKEKLKSAIDEIEGDKMPLKSYKLLHPESRLKSADKESIIKLFTQKRSGSENEKEMELKEVNNKHDNDD
jgi:hypothetical protein